MSKSPNLSVKKPISVWNKPLKADFKSFFKAIGKAGVDAASGQWIGLGKDAVDALSAIGLESNKPEELAWALIYNSLTKAIASIISDSQFLMQNIPDNIDGVSDRLDYSLESNELELSSDFFEHPERLSVVHDIKTPLRQWLIIFGVEKFQAEVLSNRLPAYFVFALNKEWGHHAQDYARITTAVETPFTQASEREHGWRLYNSWLHKQIQEPMLFEAFGLEDIYVPLRAYHRQTSKVGTEDEEEEFVARTLPGERENYTRIVVDLEECLKSWLRTANKNDAIRIISGGPGSGKSSFAKIFTAHHANEATFPVLFVPLHQLHDPSGDLIKRMDEFVRYDEYLNINPLNPDDHDLRLLIIFDGLDELALQGKLAKEVAQDFVREVKDKVSQFNRSKTRLQVVFTGREVAVQESFNDPQQILHVLPYFVTEEHRKEENGEAYVDDHNLLAHDQRNDWWKKYGIATQTPHTEMPQELDRGNLTEITTQPLLNYLVALSYVQGKLTLSEQTNLNTVYADLLNAVYERGYEDNRKHRAIGDMEKWQFIRVLEEIALAAWHGDGRTTTVEEIKRHCESSGLEKLLAIFEEGAKAGVTRLLAAFYFRQNGIRGNEHTFEFTHKSFGEYLTACRIVRSMERIQKQLDHRKNDMEEGWDERAALLHWTEICGPSRIDTYLMSFLHDEVALKPIEQVRQWQKTFSHLIGVMLRQGMPMEKIEPTLKFHQANQWAINAEETLLAALSACSRLTLVISEVDWPSVEAFGTWLKRIQGQRISGDNVAALNNLNYLNLQGNALIIQDLIFANLHKTCLDQASLSWSNLLAANLSQVSLKEANLSTTYLYSATFQEANLEGANLERANLERANLKGANLKGANLEGANLERAILHCTMLAEANLRNICWSDETIWGGVKGLETAKNVPEKLKQQLGLA